MTTPQKTIDYDAVYNELVKGLREDTNGIFQFHRSNGNHHLQLYFREMRTLYMGGSRQTGRTQWILEQMEADPDSIAIVINLPMRDILLQRSSDPSALGKRVFTAYGIRQELINKRVASPRIHRHYTRVFVDDSTYLFGKYLKRLEFYSWVSKEGVLDRHVVMVG